MLMKELGKQLIFNPCGSPTVSLGHSSTTPGGAVVLPSPSTRMVPKWGVATDICICNPSGLKYLGYTNHEEQNI